MSFCFSLFKPKICFNILTITGGIPISGGETDSGSGGGCRLCCLLRPQAGQDYREDDQTVVQPEDHSQGEDLEECEKDVTRGHGAECQGQEGCQTTVENCGADGDQSIDCPL